MLTCVLLDTSLQCQQDKNYQNDFQERVLRKKPVGFWIIP